MESLGEQHVATLSILFKPALTHQYQERRLQAEEFFARAVNASCEHLGLGHPHILVGQVGQGSASLNEGRLESARDLLRHVPLKLKETVGEEHPDALKCRECLSLILRQYGKLNESQRLREQVMETRKKVPSLEHPDTLTSRSNLVSIYGDQRRWKEAEELDVQVIETRKRALGENHPDTLISMPNLAFTFTSQGRDDEALLLIGNCFQVRKRILGPLSPHIEQIRNGRV